MREFVRPVHEHIKDLFILDIEAFCDFADNLKYHIPDSLSESKFHATLGSIHKKSSNGFVVGEALSSGEDVVLHGRDGSHCYLRGEVPHLVLAQSESSLTLLKDNFQGPAPGVDPVGFEEVEFLVCGKESVPLPSFVTLGEEQTYVAASKGHVDGDMVASQTAAILATLLRMVEEGDELVGSVLLTFICILRLAHLDHAKVMASDVSGSDEQDDFCTGKPTVGQHIVEMDLALDNAAYHLYHQGNLALVVFLNPLGSMGVFRMLLGETGIKLFLLQSVVPILAFLTDKGEVKQHLADTVGNADEQPLETEHHRVCDMRVYLADKLRLDTTLGIVRIIYHQAYRLCALRSPLLLGLVPELKRDGGKNSAPVIRLIGDKSVEHVLPAVKQAA